MIWAVILSLLALALALGSLSWSLWNRRILRVLGLGLGSDAGPLLVRLEAAGRRLEALEKRDDGLEEMLGMAGLRPAVVHYAPLGLGGIRHCFVLALLNRKGDGIVLNYLTGTGIRLDLKEVWGWKTVGPAPTPEEEQAIEAARKGWEARAEQFASPDPRGTL